jgi:hypothetical protein
MTTEPTSAALDEVVYAIATWATEEFNIRTDQEEAWILTAAASAARASLAVGDIAGAVGSLEAVLKALGAGDCTWDSDDFFDQFSHLFDGTFTVAFVVARTAGEAAWLALNPGGPEHGGLSDAAVAAITDPARSLTC